MSFQDELIARALEQWDRFGRDEDRDDKFVDAEGKTTKDKHQMECRTGARKPLSRSPATPTES
jgi:hypothetical protein